MLILEKTRFEFFLLVDENTNEPIIVTRKEALEIKAKALTTGKLLQELYRLFGNSRKWRIILDRNLGRANSQYKENIELLLVSFATLCN